MRVKVRATILLDGRLVVSEETRRGEPHLTLPGGRPNRYESVRDALVREVEEETGLVVEVERLLYVTEAVEPYKLEDLTLVFLASIQERPPDASFRLVDLPSAEDVLPPLLRELAEDAASGWASTPRWLGNTWRPRSSM
jgi:ADP-ribose pyrophosphatase YjhB (NUDIX family)